MKNRMLSILIRLCFCAILLPVISIKVTAADPVKYMDIYGVEQSASATKVLPSGTPVTWNTGWYYVQGDVVVSDTITVSGDVSLILTDGSSLTVNGQNFCGALLLIEGNSLTIYAQSGGTGALKATGGWYAAGIGSYTPNTTRPPDCGTVTINGGFVTAAGTNAAGIGGGYAGGGGGVVTINGGTVKATGHSNAAGIGGGMGGAGGSVTINGGSVTATGGHAGAGIGGGAGDDGGSVIINGGTITANGGSQGGAAIGGGWQSKGGTVTINGGSIKATGGGGAQAIGSGKDAISGTAFTAKNNSGDNVYLTTVALSGVTSNSAITSLTTSTSYDIKDVQTDSAGKLYLYLPLNSTVTEVESLSKVYYGTVITLGNGSNNGILYTVLVSDVSVPTEGTYTIGQSLDFTVRFTHGVTVDVSGGVPYIPLTVGNTAREAAYISGSGSEELLFRCTVPPGDNDLDGISIGGSIVLNGGTIKSGGDTVGVALISVGSTADVLVDTPPLVTIRSSAATLTNLNPIPITIAFSEIVTGFDIEDLIVGNGTPTNFSGSGMSYTADITPLADGSVTVDIAAGAAQDISSNSNTAATRFSVSYDGTAPTAEISSSAANPTKLNPIPVTITFSEIVSGFDIEDLTVGNGTPTNFSGSGTTYTTDITPWADGSVTVDIAAGAAHDIAGNSNTAATLLSVSYDGTAPTAEISSSAANPTNLNPIPVTITFSEIVTGFDIEDLTVANGTPTNFSGSGTTYTADITPLAEGSVTVDIAAGAACDIVGNSNTAATLLSVSYDGTAPYVYSMMPADASVNVPACGNIVVSFSEKMDILSGTITLEPSTGSTVALTDGIWSGGNTVYTAPYSALAYDTDYTVLINGFKDAASNIMPVCSHGFTTELEPLVPTVAPNSLTIGKGGTANLSVALGQGTAGAVSASLMVSDSAIAKVNITSLTENGSVIVSGLTLGMTEITVTFYDTDGILDTVNVSVTVEAVPPTWPPDSSLTASDITYTKALLKWTAAKDVTEVTKYRIYQDGVLLETLDNSTFTYNVTELSASTAYSFQVQAGNGDGMWSADGPIVVVSTRTPPSYSGDSSLKATIITENGATDALAIKTGGSQVSAALSPAQSNVLASEELTLTFPSVSNATSYEVQLPTGSLSGDARGKLTIDTELGSISLPSKILSSSSDASDQIFRITIGRSSVSGLPDNVQEKIGDRPLVNLKMSVNKTKADWSDSNSFITVSIPYTPTAEELTHPESIVVWHVDGDGNLNCVTNGRYDPKTGKVVFHVTHFSYFAVAYNSISFSDVDENAWYFKAVKYLSARGITDGTGEGKFSPNARLTRGEFIVMLMRAYEINPDNSPADNFSDAGSAYYTGYLAAAKRLGLADGVGSNRYAPERDITRQEMFTLLYKILTDINRAPQGDTSKTISDFSDAGQIEPWAMDAVALLVGSGIVEGNTGKLSPTDRATRAEMAQMLYNLEYLMQWLHTQ